MIILGTTNTWIDFRLHGTTFAGIQTNRGYFYFYNEIRVADGLYGTANNNDFRMLTNGIERMRILNSNGNVGIRTTTPTHDLQIHGIYDYVTNSNPVEMEDPTPSPDGIEVNTLGTYNHGKAASISLTNSNTNTDIYAGGLLMQADNNLYLWNRENGTLSLTAPGVNWVLSSQTQRIFSGIGPNTNEQYGRVTVQSGNDNGLYVRTSSSGKYAIMAVANDDQPTFVSYSNLDLTKQNFKVNGNGDVFARKYITTLLPFPDYVFSDDYQLMTFQALRNYIALNKHLPNIPKAEIVEQEGMDLGELNRILVEKVEELTLYILELEERLSEVESDDTPTNSEENALLEERISRLEGLLEEMKN